MRLLISSLSAFLGGMLAVDAITKVDSQSYGAKRAIFASLANDRLELILFPTEQCNFRCIYCYEDFEIGKMHPKVVSGVKSLIRNKIPNLKYLQINWFGGEPLIAKDIVSDICTFTKETRTELNPDLNFRSGMTTNGALLNVKEFDKFVKLGVSSYQISLDGYQDHHDQTRLRANGAGTFKQIWNNLCAVKDSDSMANILLRIHMTPDNTDSILTLLEAFKREIDDTRFTFFFKPVGDWGGKQKFAYYKRNDTNQLSRVMRTVRQEATRLGLQYSNSGSSHKDKYICYAAKANALTIRADGTIGKCTVALKDQRNSIGRITPDGKLQIDPHKLAPWMRGLNTMDFNALGCPYNGLPKAESDSASKPIKPKSAETYKSPKPVILYQNT